MEIWSGPERKTLDKTVNESIFTRDPTTRLSKFLTTCLQRMGWWQERNKLQGQSANSYPVIQLRKQLPQGGVKLQN